jgi:XRE family transcriptional regulator, aerobic/anaerobic benzoate catabolism transcriptional regulator
MAIYCLLLRQQADNPMSEDQALVETKADGEHKLLQTAGERIRALRALRGMSRKMVADQADVSERHLGLIETGKGNVSIRLLGRIASALGVPAGELLSPSPGHHVRLLGELLATLSDDEQQEAFRLLRTRFRDAGKGRRVTLIGLRGAGKSTLGRRLAERYGVPFVRISREVERLAGMPIAEVHELVGQLGYRRFEQQAVQRMLTDHRCAVIEAGGSIVANAGAFEALLRESHVVWLQASPREHMERVIRQGDLRPIGGREDAMDDLMAMLSERTPLYAHAHATLDTTRTTEDDSFDALCAIADPHLGETQP